MADAADNADAFTPADWSLFLGISAIWGASFLLIAEGLEVLRPGLITWMRVCLGAAALLVVPAARRWVAREDRLNLVVLAVLWIGIPFTLFPLAQEHVSSAVAGMLNGGTPVFTALVGFFFVRTGPGRTQGIGVAVGLAGVVLISLAQSSVGDSALVGIGMVIGATLCYGFAIHIAAPLQRRYGSLAIMAQMLLVGSVLTAPFGLLSIEGSRFAAQPVAAVVLLGVVGTGVAFAVMGALVGRVGSTRASFITYAVPVIALALGVTVRGEHVRPAAGAGVMLVIAGAALASRRVVTRRAGTARGRVGSRRR